MSCTCGRTSQMPDKHASPMPSACTDGPRSRAASSGEGCSRTATSQPDDTMFRRAVRGKASPDDSADATQLIKSGAPIAFPRAALNPTGRDRRELMRLAVACVWF